MGAIRRFAIPGLALLLLAACSGPQALTQDVAEQLAGVAEAGDEFLIAMMASPTDFALASEGGVAAAAPLANLFATAEVSPQQTAQCFEETTSSPDADGDDIPASASYTIDCTLTGEGGASLTMSGSLTVEDDDDGDPTSGYQVQVTAFEFRAVSSNGDVVTLTLDLDFDLDKGAGNSYMAAFDFDFGISTPNGSGSIAYAFDHSYTPDDPLNPFAAGTFVLDGTLTFQRNARVYRLTRTSPGLHFSESCTLTAFDSGTVTHADSLGNTLVITYNSCGDVTATYNGLVMTAY